MKLLFVHDHPFYKDEKNIVYTGGSFPKNLWDNYLINFKIISVFGRNSNSIKSKNGISSKNGVNFYLTKNYTSIKSLLKNYNKINNELEKLIIENDIILIRLPSILGIIAGNIALKHKKKIWVEQVGNAKEALDKHGSLIGKITAPFLHFLNKNIVKKANYISYVTEKKLQIDYPCNSSSIQVALSDVIINNILSENEIDKENRFYIGHFKIGIIGGFDTKYKGFDIFLKAVNELPEKIKLNIEFYFIGKGDPQWIIDLSKELNLFNNIKFIGPLKAGEEINNLLASLSLYIQPSLTEGMPRALLESMAMGCPCLGSNVGGIPDILDDKDIHQAGDYVKLAEQIKSYYNNRVDLEKESISNLIKIEPYLFTNLNKRRLDFYNRMNIYNNAN